MDVTVYYLQAIQNKMTERYRPESETHLSQYFLNFAGIPLLDYGL